MRLKFIISFTKIRVTFSMKTETSMFDIIYGYSEEYIINPDISIRGFKIFQEGLENEL
jgi:hypothetical protein